MINLLLSWNYKSISKRDTASFGVKLICHPWFTEGKIKPVIGKIFKLNQAAEAHHFIQDRKNIGKIVIEFS